MDIVKAFNSNDLHTEIIIKGDVQNPLFRASDIGVVLDMGNIRTTINDFNETEKVVRSMDTPGGLQNVSFLTEKGLYKVLFKSRKPIAEKFQNWVCDIVKELRLKGTYDLQKEIEQAKVEITQIEDVKKKEYELQLAKEKITEREKVLLSQYGTAGSIFYIIRVKTFENGQYIVKVGESRIGILSRYKEHKAKYDECVLLDCFLVNRSKDFESFVIHNELVRPNKVNDLQGHENELELIRIGKNLSYKILLSTVQNNIKYFNDNNNEVRKLELELEILKTKAGNPSQSNNDDLLSQLLSTTKTLIRRIDNLERTNKEILDKLSLTQTKVVTGFNEPLSNLGPRLQKIHPETLLLVKVYESVTECMKENAEIKRPSINKAAENNTIYNGFRWVLVDRCLDPNVINDIKQTVITRPQNLGYIAKLNKEKTEILNVYLDRKTAAEKNGYASSSSLETVVKNYSLSNGSYYTLYDNCEEELRESFVEKNQGKEPLLYKDGIGQFNDKNELVQEFVCKYDCIKLLHISDKTLTKSLSKNVMYCGFYYKQIGSKLSCF